MKKSMLSKSEARRGFANQIVAALRQKGEVRPIRFDAKANELRIGKGTESYKVYLGNAYECYLDEDAHARDEVIDHYTTAFMGINQGALLADGFEQAKSHLMPHVNARAVFAIPNQTPRLDDIYWHKPIGEHLGVGLGYDLPDGIVFVSEAFLGQWGVSGDEALKIACENLRKRSSEPFDSPARGVFVSSWEDNYDASRLALTDVVREVEVKGNYVAIVPNRDKLLITGSEDREGLGVMMCLAEQEIRSPYRVSGVTVRLHDGQWETFEPDAHYSGLDGFRTLRQGSIGTKFDGQR